MTRREWALLGGIMAVAAILRFATLDVQSFDHDEAVTASKVLGPNLFDTLDVVARAERSPPLYYLLAWPWAKAFGTGEVGLRSLSALIGTLTVPAAWLAGREFVSRRVGLIAAAFVALNPYLVFYSQEARSYVLAILFVSLGLAFFARAVRRPDRRSLALWAICSVLAVCSHYFAGFAVGVEGALLLWLCGWARVRVVVAVAAVALAGIALIPLAAAQEGGVGRQNTFRGTALATRVGEVAVDYAAGEEPDPFAGNTNVDLVQGGALVGGAVALAGAGLLLMRRATDEERRAALLAGSVVAAVIAIPVLLAIGGVDYVKSRNMAIALGPLLLVAAIGFGGARAGRAGALGVAWVCALGLALTCATFISAQMQRHDWRGAAEAIAATPHPRVVVTTANGDVPLAYYLGAVRFEGGRFSDGVRIRRIDAVSTNYRVRTPGGFKLEQERGFAPILILWRFESARPRLVRPDDVADRAVLSEASEALLVRPH